MNGGWTQGRLKRSNALHRDVLGDLLDVHCRKHLLEGLEACLRLQLLVPHLVERRDQVVRRAREQGAQTWEIYAASLWMRHAACGMLRFLAEASGGSSDPWISAWPPSESLTYNL